MSNIIKIKINNEEYEIDLEEDSNINITSIFSNSLKVETLTTDKINGEKIVADNIYSDSTNKVYVSSSSGEGEFKTLKITPEFRTSDEVFVFEPISYVTRNSYDSSSLKTAFATNMCFSLDNPASPTSVPMYEGYWYLVTDCYDYRDFTRTTLFGLAYCYRRDASTHMSYAMFIGLPDYSYTSSERVYILRLAYNGGSINIPSAFRSTVSYK